MAELNLDYYTAKDHYSDGDIEETLLKMAQEGKSFEDLPEEEVSFPMVYHFSGLRENILSWYPLKKRIPFWRSEPDAEPLPECFAARPVM